ncbi:MoxR family ATPase [Cryptosporangium japonicum]|uniref:MoxR family ATPase n=1 Tax=Cryptosporangium japonicum TaxID=80872 RepID=A0ABP3EVN5_9ACTN
MTDDVAGFATDFAAAADAVERVVYGRRDAVENALICLFAQGHLLIEDVPGVGKTSLARSLAATVDVECKRIQFTPDLLPSDITGVSVFRREREDFVFRPGPVLSPVVLADEINRASPKTQAALLEVMEERQVTVDGTAHPAPRPFLVIATQNPIEMDGTYPLPEAQIDRFLMRIRMGYPDHDAETRILRRIRAATPSEPPEPVLGAERLRAHGRLVAGIHVEDVIDDYLVRLVAATRTGNDPEIALGASPRATQALMRVAQVRAAADGRDFVVPEDVKAGAEPVLAHRLRLRPEAELSGVTGSDVVARLLDEVPVPDLVAAGRGAVPGPGASS